MLQGPLPPTVHDDPLFKRARIAHTRLYIETWKLMSCRVFQHEPGRKGEAGSAVIIAQAVMLGDLQGKPMGASDIARFLELPRKSVGNKLNLLVELGHIKKIARAKYEPTEAFRAMPLDRAKKFKKVVKRYLDDTLPALTREQL